MTNLKINKDDYKVSDDNFYNQATSKNRIIIGNTNSVGMTHYIGWGLRLGGKYKKTAMFTIRLDGEIIQHFKPNYFSSFIGDSKIDETSISILLENEGWLELINEDKKEYINTVGHIYKREGSVFEKRWRGKTHWAPYTKEQLESTHKLVRALCIDFDIPTKAISHNTNFDNAKNYNGLLYRSNFDRYHTDVNPNWDCEGIKNKLENIDYEY